MVHLFILCTICCVFFLITGLESENLCTLCTTAACNLCHLDLDCLLASVASELYLSGHLCSLTTLTVLEVVNVEDWQSIGLSCVCIVASSRLAEATRSLTFGHIQNWRDTVSMIDVCEVQSLRFNHLPCAWLHSWFTDCAASVVWIWYSMMCVIVTCEWVNITGYWGVHTDLFMGFSITVASFVTSWIPWSCVILWCARHGSIFTFTVSALVVQDFIVLVDSSVNLTWTWASIAALRLCCFLIRTVARPDISGSCSCSISTSSRTT